MSWDAYLNDDRGHEEGSWNFTHNCNGMIRHALHIAGHPDGIWWDGFNGLSGPEGAAILNDVIRVLELNPEVYDAMNPENGWGSRETLVKVLTEMKNAVPEWPTVWSISG